MPSTSARSARSATVRSTLSWLAGFALALAALGGAPRAAAATKVVGSGSPASCTETALRTALSGGGTISFNCGGAATIRLAALIEIAAATIIDGGGVITLDGGGATRIFYVNKWEKQPGLRFELRNITLTNGQASGSLDPTYGGCVYARRSTARLVNVTMRSCHAAAGGGALEVYGGAATIEGSSFSANSSTQGGALHGTEASELTVVGGTFQENQAAGDGGAIYMNGSPLSVQGTTFSANDAKGTTGKPYAGLGGAIYTNNPGAVITVTSSTFTGNHAHESGGAIFTDYDASSTISASAFSANISAGASGNGGAIGTAGSTMNIMGSQFRNNQSNAGGAIFNGKGSTMTLANSVVDTNSSSGSGGGIYTIGASLLIVDTAVSNNVAGTPTSNDKQGGGLVIYSNSTVEVLRSSFSGNRASGTNAPGGGIFVSNATLSVKQSTISANSAVRGGGIWYNSGSTSVTSSTVANNSASSSGANIGINTSAGAPTVASSLLIAADGVASCNKPVTDGGHNMQFPDQSCSQSIVVANPRLGPLSNNGGPTATMALATGSPAIDSGSSTNCDSIDQRGYSRDGVCDVGAFEFGSQGPPNMSNHIFLPTVRR